MELRFLERACGYHRNAQLMRGCCAGAEVTGDRSALRGMNSAPHFPAQEEHAESGNGRAIEDQERERDAGKAIDGPRLG